MAQYSYPRNWPRLSSVYCTTKIASRNCKGGLEAMSEVSFRFDDKVYTGIHGEPMAAALLRNGLLTITNSTYHARPRGIVGLGAEEPNALLQLVSGTQESMLPATLIEVTEGHEARSLTGVGAL